MKVEILRFPRSPETAVGLASGQKICSLKATLGNSAESVDDALRTGLWALYYDVPWVFWGWNMAHEVEWLISEDWLLLLKASWGSRICEGHGGISHITAMCAGACLYLVWSIWEWKPNTLPCGTRGWLSAGWLEAHTLDQHATWPICCRYVCLKPELWWRPHRVPLRRHPTSL